MHFTSFANFHASGSALVDENMIIINSLTGSVDVYDFEKAYLIKRMQHPVDEGLMLDLSLTRQSEWLVVGGDSGHARIFDVASGAILHDLEIPTSKRAQTVAVSDPCFHSQPIISFILDLSKHPGRFYSSGVR
jgi:hypothetical protein